MIRGEEGVRQTLFFGGCFHFFAGEAEAGAVVDMEGCFGVDV